MNAQPPFMFAGQEEKVKSYRPIAELVPSHWYEGDIFANGIRQHYYRAGNGERPLLLLLHGFNAYGLGWLHVAKELRRGRRGLRARCTRTGSRDTSSPEQRSPASGSGRASGNRPARSQ